jgi:hypothetical protein
LKLGHHSVVKRKQEVPCLKELVRDSISKAISLIIRHAGDIAVCLKNSLHTRSRNIITVGIGSRIVPLIGTAGTSRIGENFIEFSRRHFRSCRVEQASVAIVAIEIVQKIVSIKRRDITFLTGRIDGLFDKLLLFVDVLNKETISFTFVRTNGDGVSVGCHILNSDCNTSHDKPPRKENIENI